MSPDLSQFKPNQNELNKQTSRPEKEKERKDCPRKIKFSFVVLSFGPFVMIVTM
jgi:hypothetical protein